MLIKLQCVVYQWIRLDKLYYLMENFSNLVFKLLAENRVNIDRSAMYYSYIYISMDLTLQTNGKLFSSFRIIFRIS